MKRVSVVLASTVLIVATANAQHRSTRPPSNPLWCAPGAAEPRQCREDRTLCEALANMDEISALLTDASPPPQVACVPLAAPAYCFSVREGFHAADGPPTYNCYATETACTTAQRSANGPGAPGRRDNPIRSVSACTHRL